MIFRIMAASLLLVCCAAAQGVTIKDARGRCQLTVPAGGLAIPGMYRSADKSVTVVLDWDSDTVKQMTDTELKDFHYVKAFENTNARLWVERDPKLATQNLRTWHVYVPSGAGRCHAGIGSKPDAAEEPLKKIALSLAAAK